MKTAIYATLLTAFTLIVQPSLSQDKKYRDFYKSINETQNSAKVFNAEDIQSSDVIIETITASQLDSLKKNMGGVTDIVVKGKSILHPAVTSGSESTPKVSEQLLSVVETSQPNPIAGVGRVSLDPKVPGIATIRRKPGETNTVASVVPNGVQQPEKNVEPQSSSYNFTDGDWKLFKAANVSLIDQRDQGFLKKYSIVLGTFKSLNNADFIKRTFNSMGEHSIVVKNDQGSYYALLGRYDTEAQAVSALESVTKRYTEGISRTRRISRFGIPLDDMWILIAK